jgi:hypothetical protein
MGDILSFPKKPERGEDWPWLVLKEVIEDQVKRSAPEVAPAAYAAISEAVAERMKPDVLRWIGLAQEVAQGIPSEESRESFSGRWTT